MSVDPVLERARAGTRAHSSSSIRRHDPELRELAGDEARLAAYVEAYRELPALAPEADVGDWLEAIVRRAGARRRWGGPTSTTSGRRLAAIPGRCRRPPSPPPELPERRFPVVPRLQRRRRLQGPG